MGKRSVSRAEKAELHRKRVQALENRQKEKREESRDDDEIDFDDDEMDDFDFDDEDLDFDNGIPADEVIALLRRIEWNRKALEDAHNKLKEWCSQSTDLADSWRRFTAAGGIGADDFMRFLDGHFNHRPTRGKRHLRLVSNTKPQLRRLYRRVTMMPLELSRECTNDGITHCVHTHTPKIECTLAHIPTNRLKN